MDSPVRRFALVLGLVVALGTWGAGGLPMYTLTAAVSQVPGQPPNACLEGMLYGPEKGCVGGGPLITGVNMAAFPRLKRYDNGTLWAGYEAPLHLVGTWDGRALNLTQPPTVATERDIREPTFCPYGEEQFGPNTHLSDMDETLVKEVHMTAWGPCNGSTGIVVWVADAKTVTAVTSRIPGAEVTGWMQPVSRS